MLSAVRALEVQVVGYMLSFVWFREKVMRLKNFRHLSSRSCVTFLVAMISGCGSGQQTLNVPADITIADNNEPTITNDGPEGNSRLTFSGISFPLDIAIGDVRGKQGDHYLVSFTLMNGTVAVESVSVDGQELQILVPLSGTALMQADIYSVGEELVFNAYAFVATDDSSSFMQPGVGYFSNASVGVDINLDGMVSEDERLHVIDGVLDFTDSQPSDIVLNFAMTLDGGISVTGEYTGLVDFTFR